MAHKEAPYHWNCLKVELNPWPISSTSRVVIYCLYKPTSDIQSSPEHSWTSDRPQKQASAKADPLTFGSGVISLLMELSIDDMKTVFIIECIIKRRVLQSWSQTFIIVTLLQHSTYLVYSASLPTEATTCTLPRQSRSAKFTSRDTCTLTWFTPWTKDVFSA